MTADRIIIVGRRAAERLMTSTCAIARETGQTLNQTTLLYDDQLAPVWTGPCRVKFGMNRVSPREVEGQLDTAQQLILFVPVIGTGDITVNDTVTITDGGIDPTLTGRQFRISGQFSQTYATSRRLPIEAVT